MNGEATSAADFGSLIPLIILMIPLWIAIIRLARRKGLSTTVYWWTGWIPILNFALCLYLAGITDKAVYDKLDALSAVLANRDNVQPV